MKPFFVNMDILITVTLFLLVIFSAFIATKGTVTDDRYNGCKRFTKYGRTFMAVNVIMLFILISQHYHNKYIAKINDQEYQIKQDTRDSIVKVRYDSSLMVMKSEFDASNIRTIATVADMLGKYGYKLDSVNRRLVKVLKEAPRTNVMFSNDPVLVCSAFTLYEQTRGISVYEVDLCSYYAGSAEFDIQGNFAAANSLHHNIYLGGKNILDLEDRIPKDSINSFYIGINNDSLFSYVFIRLSGSYKNMEGSKTFHIDDVIVYDINAKTFFTAARSIREEIIAFMENNTK
jgi:hypothetical protein